MIFNPKEIFTKGIVYAEFFDCATDNLVGFSRYVSDFAFNGSFNDGPVEGGPGNLLVMNIPDTSRLAITAKTTDDSLDNMALTIGQSLSGNGIVETSKPITAASTSLSIANAVAPYGGVNGAICYILSSSGADNSTVMANSGTAYKIVNGTVSGFTAVSGNTYCVKYFTQVSSAMALTVNALFQPKVVRAHFAVNCYAKGTGGALTGSIFKIRHYYVPYYFFTNPLADTVNQTANGSVDLSGNCLTYEEVQGGVCSSNAIGNYCYIVDEFVDGSSTGEVKGIYFIGAGSGVSVAAAATEELVVKYDIADKLTNISDMSQVTFSSSDTTKAIFENTHQPVVKGVAAGSATLTASVTNSQTGVTYVDTIACTVTA